MSLPKLSVSLLLNLSSKSVEKDGVLCDMSQTSLDKIGSSEKAVKHAVEPGVNVLLASHSFFRDAPQITIWEHLTATPEADVKQPWPGLGFLLPQSLRDGFWEWLPKLKSISHLSLYKPLQISFITLVAQVVFSRNRLLKR